MRDDKIFNNRFNTGEMDFDFFGSITKMNIEGDGSDDVYENYNELEFQKVLYEIFKTAPFFDDYSKTKRYQEMKSLRSITTLKKGYLITKI
jgi:hypothetical protein